MNDAARRQQKQRRRESIKEVELRDGSDSLVTEGAAAKTAAAEPIIYSFDDRMSALTLEEGKEKQKEKR